MMGVMKKALLSLSSVFLPLMVAQASGVWQLPAAPPEIADGGEAAEAVRLCRAGCPAAAADVARPLAEKGDADAWFVLAYVMEAREPAKLSRAQAMDHHYRKAAEAGHPEAGWRRMLIPLTAGSEQERGEARAALEAAAQGDPRACRILGEAWLRGLVSGKADAVKAVECWKAAGEKGDAEALILLARLHEGDFGFPEMKDEGKVIACYRDAARAGDGDAFVPLGRILLESRRSQDEQAEGREWLMKAVDRKHAAAWQVLGDHEKAAGKDEAAVDVYQRGAGAGDAGCMERLADLASGTERREWLAKASAAGSVTAAAELGRLLLAEGNPDLPQARRYLIQAACEGIWQAQRDLGMSYLEGRDGARDPEAAVRWLTEAMKGGDAEVQYQLATLHQQGIGGPVNYANAGVLYTLACNKGHAGAAARIAEMALEGLGTKKDAAQAKAHAMLAVERGDVSAKVVLTELAGKLDAEQEAKAEKALGELRAMAKGGGKKEGVRGQ